MQAETTFGSEMRRAREAAKLTLNRFSDILEALGGPRYGCTYLSQIERGLRNPPRSDEYVRRIAQVLEIDPDWMFYLAGRIPPDYRDLPKEKAERFLNCLKAAF